MVECGKGCMPECEYFTTGGCISPFNCPYKIEMGYINSVTSTPDSLTDLLIEFDEMGFAPTTPCPNSEEYAIGWRGKVRKEIERLKAENAALRARLDKSVALPFGNRVWFIVEDEEGEESYIISKPTDLLTVDELYEIGKKYFTTRAAAEKRLAELKGENCANKT